MSYLAFLILLCSPEHIENKKKSDEIEEVIDALTYNFDCKGAEGDMVYLKDIDDGPGYGVSEVKVFTKGQ